MRRRDFLRRTAVLAGSSAIVGWRSFTPLANAAGVVPDSLFNQTLPDVDGKDFPLKQWLGKPIVVNFWATWCPPCVKEMPDLEALHKKYDMAVFLGLGVDTSSNVRAFTKKVHVSYPLLLAGHEGIALMRTLGNKNGGLPFTVLFDAKGRVHSKVLGQIKPNELESALQGLLATPSS